MNTYLKKIMACCQTAHASIAQHLNFIYFFIVSTIFVFTPVVLWNQALLSGALTGFYPQKLFLWRSIMQEGIFPLWNSHLFGGVPFLADPNIGSLFPLNIVFLFFTEENFHHAFSFFIALHYFILQIGLYVFLRELQCKKSVAAFGATLFSFSGLLLSLHTILHMLGAFTFVPWYLWSLLGIFNQFNLRKIFFASLMLGFTILAGNVQISLILVLGSFSLPFFLTKIRKSFFQMQVSNVLILFLACLLSAPQLLSTLDFIYNQGQSSANSLYNALGWSLHPYRLAELFYIDFFGQFGHPGHWGSFLGRTAKTYIGSIYLSSLIMLPTFMYFALLITKQIEFKKLDRLIVALLIVVFLISLGEFSPIPIYKWLFEYLPFWSYFRYPEKNIIWLALLLLILACRSLSIILDNVHQVKFVRTILAASLIYFCSLITVALLFAQKIDYRHYHEFIISFAFVALLLAYSKIPWTKYCFPLLVIAQILVSPERTLFAFPKEITDSKRQLIPSKIIRDMKKNEALFKSGGAKRFHIQTNALFFSKEFEGLQPVQTVGAWAMMSEAIPTAYKTYSALGASAFQTNTYNQIWKELRVSHPDRLMNLLSVRYYMTMDSQQKPQLRLMNQPLPYVFIPKIIIQSSSTRETIDALKSESIDIHTEAIIQTGLQALSHHVASDIGITDLNHTVNQIDFNVELQGQKNDFYLIVNENYNKNWRLKVGDKVAKTALANGLMMAIPIQDIHDDIQSISVQLKYEDNGFRLGLFFSLSWILLFLAQIILPRYGLKKRFNAI